MSFTDFSKIEVIFKDSKLPFTELKYKWMGFVSMDTVLKEDLAGFSRFCKSSLVEDAQRHAERIGANAIVDASFNDHHFGDKIYREFQGTAVFFKK